MKYGTTHAIEFLIGTGTDQKGRTISEYLEFTPEKWEECHDHIQWAFPSDIPSDFNPHAPIVCLDAIQMGLYDGLTHEQCCTIVHNILLLYLNYFNSIGLSYILLDREYTCENDIRTPDNHNFRRLSRVMRSMAIIRLLLTACEACDEVLDLLPDPNKIRDYLFTVFVPQCGPHVLSPSTVYHWYTSATDILQRVEKVQNAIQSK